MKKSEYVGRRLDKKLKIYENCMLYKKETYILYAKENYTLYTQKFRAFSELISALLVAKFICYMDMICLWHLWSSRMQIATIFKNLDLKTKEKIVPDSLTEEFS